MSDELTQVWVGCDGREYHPVFESEQAAIDHGWNDADGAVAPKFIRADIHQAALTQAEARGREAGVRVKPLVWVSNTGHFAESGWNAQTPFGECYIFQGDEDDLFRWGNLEKLYGEDDGIRDEFTALDEAKAAAQAHHDATVRAMIDTDAPTYEEGRDAGIREKIDDCANEFSDCVVREYGVVDCVSTILALLTPPTPDGDSGEVTVAQAAQVADDRADGYAKTAAMHHVGSNTYAHYTTLTYICRAISDDIRALARDAGQ